MAIVTLAATACGGSTISAPSHASVDATVDAADLEGGASLDALDTSVDASDTDGDACSLAVDAPFAGASPGAAEILAFVPSCAQSPSLVEGGCSFDPRTDPSNCGACGVSCDGGACSDGGCVPLGAGVLATGQASPVALAVDATNVYWVNRGLPVGSGKQGTAWFDGQVMQCAIGGCGNRPTVLAGGFGGGQPYPGALVADSTKVYWSAGGQVLSCALGGCGCAPSIVLPVGANGLAVSEGTLYWTGPANGVVGSCAPATCASGPTRAWGYQGDPTGILAVGPDVYFTALGGVLAHCSAAGCPCDLTTLWRGTGTEAQTASLAADTTSLYWTNANPAGAGSVFRCARSDCTATAAALADNRNAPRGIATDGTNVYWSESGDIYKCAVSGCASGPTVFASGVGGPAIAVDANHVYAANVESILVFDK